TVGLCILFKNPDIVVTIANECTLWYHFCSLIEEGGWSVFRHLPLLFVVVLPIALDKKAQPRACMEAIVTYLNFNYFVKSKLTQWGSFIG
ncbi:alpha-glucoside-specific phosphotransferase enzyme IIB component, partial [Clostridium perfringens]